MPEYTRTAVAADEQQASKSPLSSLVRWLQIKKYQYEVTFSLYMLTPTEKCVFNVIIGILFTLLIATAVAYLPNHIAVISNRLWYYVHGEFLFASASAASSSTTGVDGGALQQDGMAAAAIATKGAAAAVGGVLKNVVKSEL